MNCSSVRRLLPGYLDGAAVGARTHAELSEHVSACLTCQEELERYQQISSLMSRVERVAPPPDLAVRIRLAASQRRAEWGTGGIWGRMKVLGSRADLFLKNILEPLALPATGGFGAAVLMFVVMLQVMWVQVPLGAVPGDQPTRFLVPARLERLAPFPVPGPIDSDGSSASAGPALLVEATVNSRGDMISYRILAGPVNPEIRRQLDQVLLFSRFRPQMSFGRPTDGGRVILSFSVVHVEG